jgi:hypothetical protein
MMISRISRLVLFLFILGLLLLLGLVFSSWTVPNIVLPAAQTVWLFLRMFILSVNQEFYWWLLAFCAAIWALYRLSRGDQPVQEEVHVSYNEALNNQKLWKELLAFSKGDAIQRDILRQRLIFLLASHYSTWQRGSTLLRFPVCARTRKAQGPIRAVHLPGLPAQNSPLDRARSCSI